MNCLITGVSSGLGLATEIVLAGKGHRIIGVARDPARGQAAQTLVRQSGDCELLVADLAEQQQVRDLAQIISERYDSLAFLINNAGAHHGKRELTSDGIERTSPLTRLPHFS